MGELEPAEEPEDFHKGTNVLGGSEVSRTNGLPVEFEG